MEISAIVQQALTPAILLEKLPKSVLQLYITVLEADGGEIAAAISCASLALAHANVEMYDIVAACSAVSFADVIRIARNCFDHSLLNVCGCDFRDATSPKSYWILHARK